MKYKLVLKDSPIALPLPGKYGWSTQPAPSNGVKISLDAVESTTGGLFLTEAQLLKMLGELDLLEKNEKNI